MSETTFRAFVIKQEPVQKFTRQIMTRAIFDLPDSDGFIKVQYCSLKYKVHFILRAISLIGMDAHQNHF